MTNEELIAKIKVEIERRIKFHTDAIKSCTGLNTISLTYSGGLKEDEYLLSFLSTLEEDKCYFYCKYGGILPTCSDCKRNLLNSRISKEQVQGWLSPDTHSKRCNSKIQLEEKSEKPMNQEELEKEIETYFDSNFGIPWDGCHPIGVFELDSMARHFAKWGAEHLSNPNKATEIDIEKECESYTEMLYVPELSPELNSALKTLSCCYLYNFGCHIRNLILGIPEDKFNQEVKEMVDDICKSIFDKK